MKYIAIVFSLILSIQASAQEAVYHFDNYFKMYTKTTGPKAKDNITMTQRLEFDITRKHLSLSQLSIKSDRRGANENKDIERIIVDRNVGKMYTFMKMGAKKVVMKMPFKIEDWATPSYQGPDQRYVLTDFGETGQSKKIGNELCNEYNGWADGNEVLFYVSKKKHMINDLMWIHLSVYTSYEKKRNRGRVPMNYILEYEPLKRLIIDGHIVLGYKWIDTQNNKTVETQVLEFGQRKLNFDASQYKSLF